MSSASTPLSRERRVGDPYSDEHEQDVVVRSRTATWRLLASLGVLLFGLGFLVMAGVQLADFVLARRSSSSSGSSERRATPEEEVEARCYRRRAIDPSEPRVEFYYRQQCPACTVFKPQWEAFVGEHPPERFMAIDPINADVVDCRDSGVSKVPCIVFRASAASPAVLHPNTMGLTPQDLYKWLRQQRRQARRAAAEAALVAAAE